MPWVQRSWLAAFRSPPSKRRTSPPEQKTPCGDRILQLKIALEDVRPQVWRRLLVPERMTLGTLSKTLERVMGWESYHLHEFEIDGISYGTPESDYPSDVRNERGRKLKNFDLAEGAWFEYRYDFGDNWRHHVVVEKILEPQPGGKYPVCVAGERACPPEDVGGTGGYAEFLKVLRNPKHEDHAHFREWGRRAGRDFAPKVFDIDKANAKLRPRVLLPG
ncbi:MAG: plasmid pRiA4b ORF-3 family protein [Candidatus Eremiobacteraeota bacterium]|nr:plasmid pRiA4b ORF-3 family protein [Candidatus Eremiobacteraeota bacterium]MBC5805028.1 plasmid pRiA4b ORF-3 family protein [Candidatus Eremiobacteraeota bacterium]MBC5824100.1 plasmid pRiA4b ORF-3 family protein [Candidatus Eremiobacteraeota bacterium]